MQATDLGDSHDGTERRRLNAPRDGSIPLQREMGTRDVVVVDVALQDAPGVLFAEDDQVVQAFAPDRADDSLGIGVLPGRLGRGEDLPDANRPDDPLECIAVGTIPIPQQVARLGAVSGEGLPDLLRGPSRRRMSGDVEVEDAPPVVGENHETEEQAEGGRGDDEEIAGGCGATVSGLTKMRAERH